MGNNFCFALNLKRSPELVLMDNPESGPWNRLGMYDAEQEISKHIRYGFISYLRLAGVLNSLSDDAYVIVECWAKMAAG